MFSVKEIISKPISGCVICMLKLAGDTVLLVYLKKEFVVESKHSLIISACLQMMSMGCGMVPMMYPGMQQYMPAMGMGMGMGMGMEIGMNRPMVPYPPLLPGAAMQNAAAAAQMGPRFPMAPFHLPPVPVPDPSRMQASSQQDPMLNPLVARNPNQPRLPNFNDPYQQFFGLHQAQVQLPQASPSSSTWFVVHLLSCRLCSCRNQSTTIEKSSCCIW